MINGDTNKDMIAYNNIKAKLDEEYTNLKNTLNDMTVKAEQIVAKKANTDKPPKFELFSFVKSDSEKWRQNIIEVLKLIYEVNLKSEIETKLNIILNWSAGIEQYKEESKSSSVYSVPDKIYEKELKLCKIPTQTLKKLKELENRIQNIAKASIAYQKVRISYYFRLNDMFII